jgi:hypothetical protein
MRALMIVQQFKVSAAVLLGLLFWIGFTGTAALAQSDGSGTTDEEYQRNLMNRYEQMVAYNLDNDNTVPSALIDSMMSRFQSLRLGERIAAWADYFYHRGDVNYKFGLKADGYVSRGRLVDDYNTDCVLFFYRVTELGRSNSALEAVQFAFGTRFHGASLEKVVGCEGRVDYENPVHLDYAIDQILSGIWGIDITKQVGQAKIDQAGSTRYDGGLLTFVPKAKVDYRKFRCGDLVFFVSDENQESGKNLRGFGAIIGHVGVIKTEGDKVYLIHPASKGIDGIYEGGKLEKLPLKTYLDRVENFKGIMATRIENF